MSQEVQELMKKNERSSFNKMTRRLLQVVVLLILTTQFIGCSSCNRQIAAQALDKQLACLKDRVWAKRAYNLRYGNCDRQFGDHFRNGFIDGYCKVCEGGDGYVPAVPPDCYWGYQYQSADGSKCVNAWFEGYPSGAVAAREDKADAFHDVYISRMANAAIVQNDAENIVPKNVPIVDSKNKPTPAAYPAMSQNLSSEPAPISWSMVEYSPEQSPEYSPVEALTFEDTDVEPAAYSSDQSYEAIPIVQQADFGSTRRSQK